MLGSVSRFNTDPVAVTSTLKVHALEAPIVDSVRHALQALGHDVVVERGVTFGGAQAIMRLPRGWAAGSDPRKDGMAAGH